MDIEATKLELIHRLLQTQQETLLAKLKKVFDEERGDWWKEMGEEERQEIQTGLEQADKGYANPHKKVMQRFDKWH